MNLFFYILATLLLFAPSSFAQQPTKLDPSTLQVMRLSEGAITHLDWAPDGILYTGDWKETITQWKVGRKSPSKSFKIPSGFVRSLQILEGGKKYLACINQCAVIGKFPTGTVTTKFHQLPINVPGYNSAAAASWDEKTIAVLTGSGEVILHEATKGKEIGKLTLPTGARATAITATPQGGWLVAGIGVHHFPAGSQTPDFTIGSLLGIVQIAISPDGKRLAAIHARQFLLSEFRSGADVIYVPTVEETAERLAWSPDSRRVTVCRDNGLIEFIDPIAGKVTETLTLQRGQTSCLAYSPDGTWLAIGSGHYLDMKLNPPRQKTGDNSVRLLPVNHGGTKPSR